MASTNTTIHKLDTARLESNRFYLVVGRKNSGKTTLLFTLLRDLAPRVEYVMGMCGTRDGTQRLAEVCPSDVIHGNFDPIILDGALKQMDFVCSRASAREEPIPITAVIADDCSYDRQSFKSPAMRQAAMNGRWLGLMMFITQQYLMDMTPDVRGQVDYIFALAETSKKTRQKLYEYYFSIFPTFGTFDKVFTTITAKKGRALVLDNTISGDNISERVFFYDGIPRDLLPRFTLGSRSFRSRIEQERQRRVRKSASGINVSGATAPAPASHMMPPPAARTPAAKSPLKPSDPVRI